MKTKTEVKHTPGPLEIKKSSIPGSTFEIWACNEGRKTGYTYHKGDANLYAAAPELLEAAKMANLTLEAWREYGNEPSNGELEKQLEILEAAIAKASA